MYRKNPYCHNCLKSKDILRYNPFHDVLEVITGESENIYSLDHYANEDLHTISPLHDVLENYQIRSIDSLQINSDKNALSFKFLNIDGSASNFNTFSTTLAAIAHDFTVIGITETNVESELRDLYCISGYTPIYQDRMHGKKKGSGVAMYVRNTFNFVIDKEMSILTGDIEALFIKINNETSSIIVGTVYCPPSGNYKKFLESMTNILSNLDKKEENIIIMGDFNINLFIDNKQRSAFEEAILCNGFTPTISVGTHAKPISKISCIDNILVNKTDNVRTSGVIETHISHHRSLFLAMKPLHDTSTTLRNPKPKMVLKYDYSKENLNCLTILLNEKLCCNTHINTLSDFINVLSTSIDETCKLKVSKFSKRNRITNPWITTTKICKSGDSRLHEEYRKYRNKLSSLIMCAKQQHYARMFKNSTGNLKQTWSVINELRGKSKESSSTFSKFKKAELADKKSLANKFNSYFSNLAATLNEGIPNHNDKPIEFTKFLHKSEQSSLFLNDTEENEI